MAQRADDPIMLDLETLGTSPNSVILSIGACRFDQDTMTTHDYFYQVINTKSCLEIGMQIDPKTQQWWSEQSPEAQKVIKLAEDPESSVPVEIVLANFAKYCNKPAGNKKNQTVWGNGADFDNAMLQEAYRKLGFEAPWFFWNNRCYRTMKNHYPMRPINRKGVHHDALDDARTQAEHLMNIIASARGQRTVSGIPFVGTVRYDDKTEIVRGLMPATLGSTSDPVDKS